MRALVVEWELARALTPAVGSGYAARLTQVTQAPAR
jgi:hypothetical protein